MMTGFPLDVYVSVFIRTFHMIESVSHKPARHRTRRPLPVQGIPACRKDCSA
jgi:hypothetical protein